MPGPGDKGGKRGKRGAGDRRRYRGALESYLRDIGRYPMLTQSGEFDVASQVRRGRQGARNELVQANLRLVVKIAKEYRHVSIAPEELIAEGHIGLIEAANRFDPQRGVRFVSYASWWIRKYMYLAVHRQALQTTSPARRPDGDAAPAATGARRRARPSRQRIFSIESFLQEAGDRQFLERFIDATAEDPQKVAFEHVLAEALAKTLPRLLPQEAAVLAAHFGLNGKPPRTLEQIGRSLDLTRERVRQIEMRALERARRLLGADPKHRPPRKDR